MFTATRQIASTPDPADISILSQTQSCAEWALRAFLWHWKFADYGLCQIALPHWVELSQTSANMAFQF